MLDTGGSPASLATLIRLFHLDVTVPLTKAQGVVPERMLRLCLSSGLVKQHRELLVPRFGVYPLRGKLLAFDRGSVQATGKDFVIWGGAIGTHMLNITPRSPVKAALDVCAGGGIQTLFLGDHCEAVTAIDLNSRAVAFSGFNTRLNGVGNVEILRGNRLEPVRDRSFDLIVCNPPFYIAPTLRALYSDNEMEMDEFSREIICGCSTHLNEQGYLHAVVEWVEVEGEPWQKRLEHWFEGLGCDVWVRRDYQQSVLSYSQMRLAEIPPVDKKSMCVWTDYFRRGRVKKIHGGSVAMRRRSGKNWFFFDDFDRTVDHRFGESVPRGFAERDFLAIHTSNESILNARLVVSEETRVEEHSRRKDAEWSKDLVRLRVEGGARYSGTANMSVAGFLRHLDGTRTLGEAIRASMGLGNDEPLPHPTQHAEIARKLLVRGVCSLGRSDRNDNVTVPFSN